MAISSSLLDLHTVSIFFRNSWGEKLDSFCPISLKFRSITCPSSYRITESLRMERSSKITKSSC